MRLLLYCLALWSGFHGDVHTLLGYFSFIFIVILFNLILYLYSIYLSIYLYRPISLSLSLSGFVQYFTLTVMLLTKLYIV